MSITETGSPFPISENKESPVGPSFHKATSEFMSFIENGGIAQKVRYFRNHVSRPDIAEDLTQQTLLAAWRSLPTYQDRGNPFGAWVHAIARHNLANFWRARNQTESYTEDNDGILGTLPTPGEEIVTSKIDLVEAWGLLPPLQRDSIYLHHILGLPFDEVARMVGTTKGAVKARVHRGLTSLREALS